jgi:hypothetical protein
VSADHPLGDPQHPERRKADVDDEREDDAHRREHRPGGRRARNEAAERAVEERVPEPGGNKMHDRNAQVARGDPREAAVDPEGDRDGAGEIRQDVDRDDHRGASIGGL